MSETNTARKTITKQIDGQDRVFTLPNSYDKMELIEEYQRIRKAKLLETLNMADADSGLKTVELNAFDEDPPLDYVSFLKTPRGRMFGFVLSLRHAYPKANEAEAIAQKIDFTESEEMDLTIQLWNLVRTPGPAAQQQSQQQGTATYGDGGTPPAQPNMTTYASTDQAAQGGQNPTEPATQANPA